MSDKPIMGVVVPAQGTQTEFGRAMKPVIEALRREKREKRLAALKAAVVEACKLWDAARTTYLKSRACSRTEAAAVEDLDAADEALHAACSALAKEEADHA